jgi:hypothetical protein
MGEDEVALVRLWREKRGEIEPENLSNNLIVQGGIISIQVLNEFVNVSRRKLRREWREIEEALSLLRTILDPPIPITIEVHETAVGLARDYGFSFYDSLIIANHAGWVRRHRPAQSERATDSGRRVPWRSPTVGPDDRQADGRPWFVSCDLVADCDWRGAPRSAVTFSQHLAADTLYPL